MGRIKGQFSILLVCTFVLLISSCSRIEPMDPSGFGVWADDCSGIAVAVNLKDYNYGLLNDYETNGRYDLNLCNTNGDVVKTIFTGRKIDGGSTSIDSLDYNISKGCIIIYSRAGSTKLIYKKEKVNLSDLSIEELEVINTKIWPIPISQDGLTSCGGKSIHWNSDRDWIEVKTK